MKIKGLLVVGLLLTPVIAKDFKSFENIKVISEETTGNVDIFEDVEYGIEDVEYEIEYTATYKRYDLHFYLPNNWVEIEDVLISGVQRGYNANPGSTAIGYDVEYEDYLFEDDAISVVGENELLIENAGTIISHVDAGGGHYEHFNSPVRPQVTDDLNISFQGKDGIEDSYSFANDEFDGTYQNKTQDNFYDLKASEGKELEIEKPFLTKRDTYEDLEKLIRDNKLIESKNNFPYEFADFVFLDEKGNEINKESHLNSSTINLRIESNGKSGDVIGSQDISFRILFLGDLEIAPSEDLNIYDFDERDSFSNHSSYKWVMEGGDWTLKTNIPFEISFSGEYIEYIDESGLGDPYWVHPDNSYSSDHKQIKDNKSNSISKKITLTDIEEYDWDFKYVFNADNSSNSIIEAKTYNKDDLLVEDSLSYLDINNNDKEESNEIYEANVVNNGVKVNIKSDKINVFELNDNDWEVKSDIEIADEDEKTKSITFLQEGIYAVTGEDEYGNVSFEVIEYLPSLTEDLNESKLIEFNKTNMYINNQSIAKNNYGINNDDFSDYSAHEQRRIDYFINRNNISPLETAIKISLILLIIFLIIFILIFGIVFYKKRLEKKRVDEAKESGETIFKSEIIQSLQDNAEDE